MDCGANIGMAVLFFKAVRPDSEIVAFEPHPVTFARLVETIDSNGVHDVHAENAAVGDKDGTAAFYTHQSDRGSLIGSLDRSWGGDERLEIRIVHLSGWIREPVDFLKIDVEGAEYDVIDDLIETDAIRWVREAAIEYHDLDTKPGRLTRMTKALEAAGFHIQVTPAAAGTRVGLIRAGRKMSSRWQFPEWETRRRPDDRCAPTVNRRAAAARRILPTLSGAFQDAAKRPAAVPCGGGTAFATTGRVVLAPNRCRLSLGSS